MEKASGIYLIPGNFGWDDVGSWLAVERVKGIDTAANTLTGNVLTIDTEPHIRFQRHHQNLMSSYRRLLE